MYTENIFEVAIIGGGIVGTSLFSELVRAGVKCVLLEASEDVSNGSSKANSGIIHAGYDPKPNTLMAKHNLLGNKMYPAMCKRLRISFNNCGTLVVGTKEDLPKLQELLNRGISNGVPNLRIIEEKELKEMEPNLADRIKLGLYAPTGGIVSPYLVCVALAEEGIINGGKLLCNYNVNKIFKNNDLFNISSDSSQNPTIQSKYLVNCAGANADYINTLLGLDSKKCNYVKGEYILLDKTQGDFVSRPIFPLPTILGKGVLAIPTIHGNVMFGPTATPCESDDTTVNSEGIDSIKEKISLTVKTPNFKKTIKLFAGVRAKCGDDFIIEKSNTIPNYYYTMGIQSPGLTAGPSIAKELKNLLIQNGAVTNKIKLKRRKPYPDLMAMSDQQKKKLIAKKPNYGKIICRCEQISLGEILDVIHSPLHPMSIDAIKRRIRPSMGRCQGSFCLPKLIKIISKEYNIPKEQVTLCGQGSEFVTGDLKMHGAFEKRKTVKTIVDKLKNS